MAEEKGLDENEDSSYADSHHPHRQKPIDVDLLRKSPNTFNNFALISAPSHEVIEESSSNSEEEEEDNEDVLTRILNSVKKRQNGDAAVRKRREVNNLNRSQRDDDLFFEFEDVLNKQHKIAVTSKEAMFNCEPTLSGDCAQIIIESKDPVAHSLLSLDALSSQCNFIEQFLKPYLTSVLTYQRSLYDIKFESLSSVIARFSHKSNCNEIDQTDVHNFTLIFGYCSNIYKQLANFNLMPVPSLEQTEDLKLLPICRDRSLIDAYKYLIDKDFYLQSDGGIDVVSLDQIFNYNNHKSSDSATSQPALLLPPPVVKHTSIYFSINKNDTLFLLPFYRNYLAPNFLNKPLDTAFHFEIVAVNFDIKIELFNMQIQSTGYFYIVLLLVILFLLSLAYLKSVLVSIAMIVSILLALLEAYFIYKLALKIDHFSYLHLCSILFLIVGSSRSAFVFSDIWTEAKVKYRNFLLIDNQLDPIETNPSALMNTARGISLSHVQSPKNRPKVISNSNVSSPPAAVSRPTWSANRLESDTDTGSNSSNSLYVENCLVYLFRNVTLAHLMSTLATIVCFLIQLNSSILALRLFGLYAASITFTHFILTLIIIPCTLVIQLKYTSRVKQWTRRNLLFYTGGSIEWPFKLKNQLNNCAYVYQTLFDNCLPNFLINYRCFLIPLCLALGLPGFILIFLQPSISLTNSAFSPLFVNSNPLECYDRLFSEFTQTNGVYFYQQEQLPNMRVSFVFGLVPAVAKLSTEIDQDEDNDGLGFDRENFDFYDERSQLWLLNFCKSLKKQPFNGQHNKRGIDFSTDYDTEASQQNDSDDLESLNLNNLCLIDLFKIVFSRKCSNDPADFINYVCCDQTFPFESNSFQLCLRNVTFLERYLLPYQNLLTERLYFNKTNGLIVALEFQLTSIHKWTPNYQNMSLIYGELEQFFRRQVSFKIVDLSSDQPSVNNGRKNLVKNGFFESEFEFFDFQRTLLNETIQSFLITQLILLGLVFLSTCNILITLFSLLTLILIISTSIGLLTLFGWQVNLLESMGLVLSSAVAVEYILQFASHYSNFITGLHENNEQQFTTIFFIREHTVKNVIKKIGPALLMATLVTVLCSLPLLASSILMFKLYGVYFCILSAISFLYSMLFFAPICASFGPLTNYCKLRSSSKSSEKSFLEFRRRGGGNNNNNNNNNRGAGTRGVKKLNQINHLTTSI